MAPTNINVTMNTDTKCNLSSLDIVTSKCIESIMGQPKFLGLILSEF